MKIARIAFIIVVTLTAACQPAATAPPVAKAQAQYVALFNEPFWSFETSDGALAVTSPNQLDPITVKAIRENARYAGNSAQAFRAIYQGQPTTLLIYQLPCQDSMSGFAYSHTAVLQRYGQDFSGCARLTSEPRPTE